MAEFGFQAIPPYLERPLDHFRQRFNWDCGLSCVLMVLPNSERNYFLSNFKEICKEEGFLHSTWTIDLCYVLKRFNIVHNYFTVTIGIHPGYKQHTYYENIVHKDEPRINHRFSAAFSERLHIKRASLSIENLINHLVYHGPIIILINANLLTCDKCKINKLSLELRSCFPWPVPYMGHYIVLVGYNSYKRRILYRNPTFKDRLCVMSYHGLDIARKSYGTDEDTILIYNENVTDKKKIVFW